MIIGLCGAKQSGKDSAARVLVEKHRFVRVAFADIMRKALYALNPMVAYTSYDEDLFLQSTVDENGWDRAKEIWPEVRRLMQRFGTEMGREVFGQDFWVDRAWSEVEGNMILGHNVVISDVRFGNEIERVRSAGGVLWRIERDDLPAGDPELAKHASEREWRAATPDKIINSCPFGGYEARVTDALRWSRDVVMLRGWDAKIRG